MLGKNFIYLLGNHELLMLNCLMLRDVSALDDWMPNGGYKFFEEFGLFSEEKQIELIESPDFKDQKIKQIYEIAEWVFVNSKMFYIDDKYWLHVHAGIPNDLTKKTMLAKQAGFGRLQHQFKHFGEFESAAFHQIFADMFDFFWIRHWAYQFVTISECDFLSNNPEISQEITQHENEIKNQLSTLGASDCEEVLKETLFKILTHRNVPFILKPKDEALNDWLNSFQIQGVMFGHDHHSTLLNVGNVILGADIANKAYIIANHEAISLHQLGEQKELIMPYDKLLYRVDCQIEEIYSNL